MRDFLDGRRTILLNMLDPAGIQRLLSPFDLELNPAQISQIQTYLELLLRWNSKINLTAIRSPEECVARHFGESLYLSRRVDLTGSLLDVGSGAGFPGLALRIVFPELNTTLLEPVAKKRAFLKEAARACGFGAVEVRPERLEEFALGCHAASFDTLTARAVGDHRSLVLHAINLLKPNGRICLWVGREAGNALEGVSPEIHWGEPIRIPQGREREIRVGVLEKK